MKYIFIRNKNIFSKIILDDILFIQANGDFARIFFISKRSIVIHFSLKEFLNILPSNFFSSHRSFIVNIDKIDTIEDYTIYSNGETTPLSEFKKKELLIRLNYINSKTKTI